MKLTFNPTLNLNAAERNNLRKHKIKKAAILEYAADELEQLFEISEERAKELYALADFQRIASVGIKFAEDLYYLGFYSISELKGKSGPELLNAYEIKKGFKTDPCVEDQFWLAVDFANNENYSKQWWDFTSERKAYRAKYGYPKNRPTKSWTEIYFESSTST